MTKKKDDLPNEKVKTAEQKAPHAPAAPMAPAPPIHQTATGSINYDSNPFSITFKNFSKMFKHAQAVAIIMIVFGVFGSFGNVPSFDSSDFEDLNNNDFSLVTESKEVLGLNTVAQENSAEEALQEGVNFQLENEAETTSDIDGSAVAGIVVIVAVFFLVIFTIALAIGALWSGVVASSANMSVRDRDISFSEAFSQSTSRFGVMFVATFIAGIKIIGGYLLFIIPGIRAQARYAALPYVVMGNPSMSASQALNETKRLYDGHLLEAFSIVWVGGVIPFVGDILAAVGLAQSARQISDYKSKNLPKPAMSGWNWLPIILAICAAVFLLLLIAIVAALIQNS